MRQKKKKKGDEFREKDDVTGRKGFNPLNKSKLSREEMDDIFLDYGDEIDG